MKRTTLMLSALLASPAVLAAPAAYQQSPTPTNNHFSWTYAEAGIATHDYDGAGDNVTSLDGSLSYALDDHLYVLGGMHYGWVDSLDIWQLQGGVGYHMPLANNLDLFGDGQMIWQHTNWHSNSDDEMGYQLRAGARFRASQQVEFRGGLYHADINDSDTGLFGKAVYHLDSQLSVGAKTRLGGDETAFGLFARFNI